MTDELLRRQARWQADRLAAPEEAEIGRAVFEVTAEGRTEWVTLTFREGKLVVTSTDGQSEGAHAAAALRLLGGTAPPEAGPEIREETSPGVVETPHDPLAGALRHLVTSVARIGRRNALGSPTVEDAIARVVSASGEPPPPAIARWVGRLREALMADGGSYAAQLLSGAVALEEALESPARNAEQTGRIHAWLGPRSGRVAVETVHDRVWIELAREHLSALGPAQLQRRYLLDLSTGEILREERLHGGPPLSLGPCPRKVTVALAEIEQGPMPRRVRLFQYAVTPFVEDSAWAEVAGLAERSFSALARAYRQAFVEFPGLGEPFVLVSPSAWEQVAGLVPVDEAGDALPVARADAPGVVDLVFGRVAQKEPGWIAGRLAQLEDGLVIVPYALGGPVGSDYLRLR